MISVCVFPLASIAAGLVGRSLVVALAASPQLTGVDPAAPTPKEQALIEHACPPPLTAAAFTAHERCLGARLLSLRADFGRDLSRLSTAERRTLDATCSPAQTSRGREGYIDCLSARLASLSAGRVPAAAPAIAEPTLTAATPSFAGSSTVGPVTSSLLSAKPAAAAVAAVGAVTALLLLGVKSRRARHVCRTCGLRVPGAGDLCAACRHEAADAVRRGVSERADRLRALEAEQQQQRDHVEGQRQEQRHRDEAERLRRLEERDRLEEETRRRAEDARQTEEDARRALEGFQHAQGAAADAADSAFDPYRALGLAAGAGSDEVRAAFDEARVKYAPDQVAHLGDDAQAHFAAKLLAAERAYRMIAGAQAAR